LRTTPTAAARTARVQRAKRLTDGSDLRMTEIADQAGFQSIRSFNATFQQVYRIPPSRQRRER
jgi:AraC family transcriptional regulator of adaptative response/methylated-DNA-[protein]-cysteine methyltransferase